MMPLHSRSARLPTLIDWPEHSFPLGASHTGRGKGGGVPPRHGCGALVGSPSLVTHAAVRILDAQMQHQHRVAYKTWSRRPLALHE